MSPQDIVFSFGAGALTLLNPCVLPLLPILVASALRESALGPFALGLGLTVSFTLFGILITAFGYQIGLSADGVRVVAAAILILCGVILLVPQAQRAFSSLTAPIAAGGNSLLAQVSGDGVGGQFLVGTLLGAVWTPCVGPTLGAAIYAASQQDNLVGASLAFFVFGLGTATAFCLFAYGSRRALGQRKQAWASVAKWSKPVLGGSLLLVGIMILTGLDKRLESAALSVMPEWLLNLTTSL
ncbi:MAG: cytochrome c biogenesis CcdA family protein [Alphaproteobacteria bacterium]